MNTYHRLPVVFAREVGAHADILRESRLLKKRLLEAERLKQKRLLEECLREVESVESSLAKGPR
jgi:hypothetical protein